MHSAIQKPTLRGFPIARTRVYSACIREDFTLHNINDVTSSLEVFDRSPTFDGGKLFCAPDNIAFRYQKSIYFTFVKIDYHCHLPFNIVVVDNLLTSEQSTYIQERNMVISHQGQGQVDLFLYPCPCP